MHFDRDEESLDKAVWLLQTDALEALVDSLALTEEKRHRIAARLFRDAVETMDMSAYFYLGGEQASKDLRKWYKDEVIPHRVFRTFIRDYECKEKAKNLGALYGDLSKYTHRTYRAIGKSYILGHDKKIAYDGFSESGFRVLPHVVSLSYAIVAALIKRFITVAEDTEQLSPEKISMVWSESLEVKTVQRRFGTGPGQIVRSSPIDIDLKFDES